MIGWSLLLIPNDGVLNNDRVEFAIDTQRWGIE